MDEIVGDCDFFNKKTMSGQLTLFLGEEKSKFFLLRVNHKIRDFL